MNEKIATNDNAKNSHTTTQMESLSKIPVCCNRQQTMKDANVKMLIAAVMIAKHLLCKMKCAAFLM